MKIHPLRARCFILTNTHACTPTTHTQRTYMQPTCVSQKQQDVEQVTNKQIYTTITNQNMINLVQNNRTQVTFAYKHFVCTMRAVCSLVFSWGCSNFILLRLSCHSGGGELLKMFNANIKCTVFYKQHRLEFWYMKKVLFFFLCINTVH